MQKMITDIGNLIYQKTGCARPYGIAHKLVRMYTGPHVAETLMHIPTGSTVPYLFGACRRRWEQSGNCFYSGQLTELANKIGIEV